MSESIENIEKLHAVAVRDLQALKTAIERHTGVSVESINLLDDHVFCHVGKDNEMITSCGSSLVEMVAEIARHDPVGKDRRRLAEIDRERGELVAKLEASQ